MAALAEQLAAGVNCPLTSSLGRLFDAVAALCGVASANRYDAEAPMLLEGAAAGGIEAEYPFALTEAEPFQIDYRPMIEGIVADLDSGTAIAAISAKFHNTLAAMLAGSALRVREATSLGTVALSGGCVANRYLRGRLVTLLEAGGLEVLTGRTIPCNDGGVALGQAVSAAARLARRPGRTQRSTAHVPGDSSQD